MEPLGHGGQGSTYRGVDRETGGNVAIKVLSLKGAASWSSFDRFEREMDTLAKLSHPGVPEYVDRYAYEASGDYFLVMELVEGIPLSKRVSDARLRTANIRAILEQALDVLAYLHAQKPPLIHRDIKPANLILRPNGRVAVVDFGGVRQRAGETSTSTSIGTFGYMAPEQLHGEATPASDIYGLGATVLALLTGKSAERLPHRGLRFDFDAVELPSPFDRVLPKMLEPDPGDRLRTVEAVRAALEAKPSAPPPRAQPPRPTATPEPAAALVRVSDEARALAKTPAPLSVLVWIVAALGSGLLLVFEAVFLPFFFQVATALRNQSPDDPRAKAFEADFDQFKATVAQWRQTAGHVADGTRPRTSDS